MSAQRLLLFASILFVLAVMLACTTSSACYSTYPGCEATAQAIATAAAR